MRNNSDSEQVENQIESNTNEIFKNYLDMAVWQLRHLKVCSFIEKMAITKVVDFGCSQGLLLERMGRSSNIQLIVGVDIDDIALSKARSSIIPELIQHDIQFQREHDQSLYIFKGDISKKSQSLKEFDPQLITLVQVIEHLQEHTIDKVIFNVFGYMRPKYVFISTPNRDFNVFFKMENERFRHNDHKFQFTRAQFRQFCQKIKQNYGYQYEIDGVGEHVSNDYFGFCSQIAIFTISNVQQSFKKMEIEQQKIELVAKSRNLSWKNNKNHILLESIYKTLRNSLKMSWQQGLERIKKDKIGIFMTMKREIIDRDLIQSVISSASRSLDCDQQGYGFSQESSDEQIDES